MKSRSFSILLIIALLFSTSLFSATTVPTDVQLPGTQPQEVGSLESPNKCDNCHGGYNSAVEPAHNWRGSMMSHAGRDPIFWATVAVAEQDFDGVGDLCIRCHSTTGWLGGRSTPTDGSGLAASDSDGVDCDFCHKLTNPDDSQHLGNMSDPFIASNDNEAFYGSGMSSLWGGSDKLGPYDDADARHQFMQSFFHRDRDFCGTCHDVSNSVTGDLAHNHGQSVDPSPVIASGVPGSPVSGKAAFNNPPYAYGVVERTFSEYKAGLISQTLVDDYPNNPELPRGGVLEGIYLAATKNETTSANYQNPPAPRYFSCQTCHMRPVTGTGANKRGVPVRQDLPLHDMTGGNYWMPSVIEYLDANGKLVLGGGMSADVKAAMHDGALRAREQLELAATLEVDEQANKVRVINHTGHKLITGYPEGRRMWLNMKWYDGAGQILREDGKYGPLGVFVNGVDVKSIVDLEGGNTRIWEVHMGMTQEWAKQLVDLGYEAGLPLSYDRNDDVVMTLGELAAAQPGTEHDTFHFALNNVVTNDNRIPPYGMSYEIAKKRNALPVPADQYGIELTDGVPSGLRYEHFDEVDLVVPTNAVSADISLMYQPTSYEYIQFLALANNGENAFLGEEGANMLDAWLNTGMAEPIVMASASWGAPVDSCAAPTPVLGGAVADDKKVTINWAAIGNEDVIAYGIYYDQAGKAQWVADSVCSSGQCSHTDTSLTNGQEYCYKLTARIADCESDFSNIKCATPQPQGHQQLAGAASATSGRWITEGKGKNATRTFVTTTEFIQGDEVVFRARIVDENGAGISGATFDLGIAGPESVRITSGPSDGEGFAEANWSTQSPNKKGAGGTTTGAYVATLTGLTADGYGWDENAFQVSFSIKAQ